MNVRLRFAAPIVDPGLLIKVGSSVVLEGGTGPAAVVLNAPMASGFWQVQIGGRNFGTVTGDVQVVYGPVENPNKYSCTGISLPAGDGTQIRCTTQAGVGTKLRFKGELHC